MTSQNLHKLFFACLILCSCKKNPDAYICTFIVKNPLEKSYSFCVNSLTKEEISVPVQKMHKFITTDPDSYDTFRDFYKNQCGSKNVQDIPQANY